MRWPQCSYGFRPSGGLKGASRFCCGRILPRFPRLVARLHAMVDRFLDTVWGLDHAFVSDTRLDDLPLPAQVDEAWS